NGPLGFTSVKVSPNGEVIVAGTTNTDNNFPLSDSATIRGFLNRVNSDGFLIATRPIGSVLVRDMIIDAAGNIYAVGSFRGQLTLDGKSFSSKGESDIFVGKFSSVGALIWG